MSFFDRNRKELAGRGIDAKRLPPGQYFTDRFPVLHVGSTPQYRDLTDWTFELSGLVERPMTFSWAELKALPAVEVTTDIHCVTKWSKFDTRWKGVSIPTVLERSGVKPEATHVMFHCEHGYTANVPLPDVLAPRVALLAYEFEGEPLEPDHGYPLRSFVPHLYLWKSAKWIRGMELLAGDKPGFWERNGYNMYGDPFLEQRFWGD